MGKPGWVYVLETDVRPGVCKIGASRSEEDRRVLEVVCEIMEKDRVGYEPINSTYKKFPSLEPFWTERALLVALEPWRTRLYSESFVISYANACACAELAASLYRSDITRKDYQTEVIERVGKLMGRKDIDVGSIMGAVGEAPSRMGRSPLYLWLLDHYKEFEAQLSSLHPRWSALAETFTQFGLTDRTGERVSGETARKTWYRVRQDYPRFEAAKEAVGKPADARPAPPPRRKPAQPGMPSWFIPDPPVMPPDVRMLATDVPVQIEAAKPALPDDDEIFAKLRRGREWIG